MIDPARLIVITGQPMLSSLPEVRRMSTATITSKGQITLPKEVRDYLSLAEGDRVEFVIQPEGNVQIQPLRGSVQKLFGMLHRPGMRATTLEEMDQSLLEALAEDDARIRRGEK